MNRVAARVAPAAVLISLAFIGLAPAAVYAKSGPDNPGHHYGQKKHHHPPPAPNPTPSPAPLPQPVTGPTSAIRLLSGSNSSSAQAGALPNLPTLPTLSLPRPAPVPTGQLSLAHTWTSGGGLDWLLLLVLPLLLAVWVMVLTRMAVTARRTAMHAT